MSEGAPPVAVYQLHVWLRGISPMIWRRLLVRSDTTIAELHDVLQIAMGWADEHLHRFVIHGKAYGVAQPGGISFADDPTGVRLADFGFRPRERFRYEYDFGDGWEHVVRVERILAPDADGARGGYPVCVGGARACPPEDCGGSWAYLELRQRFHPVGVTRRLAELLGELLTVDPRTPVRDAVGDYEEELLELRHWSTAERFDRRRVNRRLRQYAAGDEAWRWPD
jgi:Plasmid pRiA4b ORF-3-like protein